MSVRLRQCTYHKCGQSTILLVSSFATIMVFLQVAINVSQLVMHKIRVQNIVDTAALVAAEIRGYGLDGGPVERQSQRFVDAALGQSPPFLASDAQDAPDGFSFFTDDTHIGLRSTRLSHINERIFDMWAMLTSQVSGAQCTPPYRQMGAPKTPNMFFPPGVAGTEAGFFFNCYSIFSPAFEDISAGGGSADGTTYSANVRLLRYRNYDYNMLVDLKTNRGGGVLDLFASPYAKSDVCETFWDTNQTGQAVGAASCCLNPATSFGCQAPLPTIWAPTNPTCKSLGTGLIPLRATGFIVREIEGYILAVADLLRQLRENDMRLMHYSRLAAYNVVKKNLPYVKDEEIVILNRPVVNWNSAILGFAVPPGAMECATINPYAFLSHYGAMGTDGYPLCQLDLGQGGYPPGSSIQAYDFNSQIFPLLSGQTQRILLALCGRGNGLPRRLLYTPRGFASNLGGDRSAFGTGATVVGVYDTSYPDPQYRRPAGANSGPQRIGLDIPIAYSNFSAAFGKKLAPAIQAWGAAAPLRAMAGSGSTWELILASRSPDSIPSTFEGLDYNQAASSLPFKLAAIQEVFRTAGAYPQYERNKVSASASRTRTACGDSQQSLPFWQCGYLFYSHIPQYGTPQPGDSIHFVGPPRDRIGPWNLASYMTTPTLIPLLGDLQMPGGVNEITPAGVARSGIGGLGISMYYGYRARGDKANPFYGPQGAALLDEIFSSYRGMRQSPLALTSQPRHTPGTPLTFKH